MDISGVYKQLDMGCSYSHYRNNECIQKKGKYGRKKNVFRIRMQRQISSWRKVISILAETGTSSDNRKFNRKKRKKIKKHKVTNAREVVILRETLKPTVQTKAQRIARYEKGKY